MGRPRKQKPSIDPMAATQRRLWMRQSLAADVVLEDESGEPLLLFSTHDISVGGLYVQSPIPMRVGARAFVSLALPTSATPIRLTAEVVRVDRKAVGSAPKGMGLRFVDVSAAQCRAIEQFCASTQGGVPHASLQ